MVLVDSRVWYNFPTFDVSDIIRKLVGSEGSSSVLEIRVILLGAQASGAFDVSRIFVNISASIACVPGLFFQVVI